ncbi:MAG: hypothetical protein M1837_001058 [Sclerophora amabilis]|nr:MAG: hypothetical protein M1837_001058 [Sclerophora amabilis]
MSQHRKTDNKQTLADFLGQIAGFPIYFLVDLTLKLHHRSKKIVLHKLEPLPERKFDLVNPPPGRKYQLKKQIRKLGSIYRGTDCMFLARLPLEIRLEIYRLVLGGNLYHLDYVGTQTYLRGRRCSRSNGVPLTCWSMIRPLASRPIVEPKFSLMKARPCPKLLALVCTSRQIYHEAIGIIYTKNEFSVKDPIVLHFMLHRLRPFALASLRSLQVIYHEAQNREAQDAFWELVAQNLTGLRNLRIFLSCATSWAPEYRHSLEAFDPIFRIKGLETFELDFEDYASWQSWTRRPQNAKVSSRLKCIMLNNAADDPGRPIIGAGA